MESVTEIPCVGCGGVGYTSEIDCEECHGTGQQHEECGCCRVAPVVLVTYDDGLEMTMCEDCARGINSETE